MDFLRNSMGMLAERLDSASSAERSIKMAVFRATSYTAAPPKPKHVDALRNLSRRSRPEVKALLDALKNRLNEAEESTDVVVILKCLTCIHRLIRSGSPTLLEEMASRSPEILAKAKDFAASKDSTSSIAQLSLLVRAYSSFIQARSINFQSYGKIIAHGVEGAGPGESSGEVAVHVAEALGDLAGAELIEEVAGLQNTLWRALDTVPHASLILGALNSSKVRGPELGTGKYGVAKAALVTVLADAALVFFVANQGLLHLCDRVVSMPAPLQRRAISELHTAQKQADALVDLFRACCIPPPDLKPIPSKFISELEEQMEASSPSSKSRSAFTRQNTISNVLTSTTKGLTAATALSSLKEYEDDQPSDTPEGGSPGNTQPDLI